MRDDDNKTSQIGDSPRTSADALVHAWPRLRPHVREAILLLIDADMIQASLRSEGQLFRESVDSLNGTDAADNGNHQ